MLNKNERERLNEIERRFAEDSPEFARKFKRVPAVKRSHRILGWVIFVLAMVLMTAAAGLYGSITVLVITFVVVAVAPTVCRYFAADEQTREAAHGGPSTRGGPPIV